jgi:hypothetical protein
MVNFTQLYSVAIRARHILSLFECQLITMLIFGGVKFLPCIIILHFLRNDLEQERAIGQIYVSITTNDFHRVNYQIQQVFLYKSSHSKMCNIMNIQIYIQQ